MKITYFYVHVHAGIDILVIIWHILARIVKFLDLRFASTTRNENWDWKNCLGVRHFYNSLLSAKYFIKTVYIFNDIIDIIFLLIISLKGKSKHERSVNGGQYQFTYLNKYINRFHFTHLSVSVWASTAATRLLYLLL